MVVDLPGKTRQKGIELRVHAPRQERCRWKEAIPDMGLQMFQIEEEGRESVEDFFLPRGQVAAVASEIGKNGFPLKTPAPVFGQNG